MHSELSESRRAGINIETGRKQWTVAAYYIDSICKYLSDANEL